MAAPSSIDIYTQYPFHLDPTTKAISLSSSSTSSLTPSQSTSISTELEELNTLHRTLLCLETPGNIPPPPLPINPKRSAQITKLRDTANAAYRKSNLAEAIKLYTYAIDMALGRPPWEPVTLVRDELSSLYANRAQAYMAQQGWPEGWVDSKCSVECKPVGNVKAWWRGGKCLAEMGRWDEARTWVERALEMEGRVPVAVAGAAAANEGMKELVALMEDIKERAGVQEQPELKA